MISKDILTSQDFTYTKSIGSNEEVPTGRFLNSGNSLFNLETSQGTVKQIRNFLSGGEQHFIVILGNGKLYSTGIDSLRVGLLGRANSGSALRYNDSIPIASETIYQVETYSRTNLVLTNEGLFSFGSNSNGQLGTGNKADSLNPVKVKGLLGKKVEQIASGGRSSYAITTDGELWAWGDNSLGQLGDSTQEDKFRPFKVLKNNGPLKNKQVIKVCAGDSFVVVLTSDNTLASFGDNSLGQLGIGVTDPSFKSKPVAIPLTGALSAVNILDVQCGSNHVVVLTTDGKVVTWGYNNYGQLGDGSTTTRFTPQLLSAPCSVKKVYSKFYSTILICTNGKMYGYGRNSNGELGLGSTASTVTSPTLYSSFSTEFVDSILDIASSSTGSFALQTMDGSIYYSGSTFSTTVFRSIGSVSNSFTKDSMYTFTYLPWYLRQSPYFNLNGKGYLLKSDKSFLSRNGLEFGYYNSTNPGSYYSSWQQVSPTSVLNNTLYGKSIYSTHIIRIKEYIYMLGGFVNNEISNSIYRAPISDPLFGWELLDQKLPFPLASGMLISDTQYVYIIGGIKQTHLFNSSRDVDAIQNLVISQTVLRTSVDSDMRNWEIMFNSKFPSVLHSAFVYKVDTDSNYYIIGGLTSLSSSQSNKIYSTSDFVSWTLKSQLTFHVNSGSSVFSSSANDVVFSGASTGSSLVGPNIYRTTRTSFPDGWVGGTTTALSTICSKYPTICN